MSVARKLVVIVLLVACVPLVVSAFFSLRIHQDAYEEKVGELQRGTAAFGAALASELFARALQSIAAVSRPIPWLDLRPDEQEGAATLLYQSDPAIAVVTIYNPAETRVLTELSVTTTAKSDRHPSLPASTLSSFRASLMNLYDETVWRPSPLPSVSIGRPLAGGEYPVIPVAVRIDGSNTAGPVIAVAISLRDLCRELLRAPTGQLATSLLTRQGQVLCGVPGAGPLDPVPPGLRALVTRMRSAPGRYTNERGNEILAAVAETATGWVVVASQNASFATAASDRMRKQAVLWIIVSFLAAVIAGLFLARVITQPVAALSQGADELAKGNLSHRISVSGHDEFSALAKAFNRMGGEVEKRDAEIRAWNETLQERVDERTRELREAQAQLLQSQKLAAVSSLAAGVAHEINNPLTGVIGLTQVLKSQSAKTDPKMATTLGKVESGAKRIQEIVATLMSLSEELGDSDVEDVNVASLMKSVMRMAELACGSKGIEVDFAMPAKSLTIRGNQGQLRQALLHVVDNAVSAMSQGGVLRCTVRSVDDALVVISIADTGRGISPDVLDRVFEPFYTTKHDWEGRGLGLSVAYRVVEDHQGTIKLDSQLGKGTTAHITLPISRGGAHLA